MQIKVLVQCCARSQNPQLRAASALGVVVKLAYLSIRLIRTGWQDWNTPYKASRMRVPVITSPTVGGPATLHPIRAAAPLRRPAFRCSASATNGAAMNGTSSNGASSNGTLRCGSKTIFTRQGILCRIASRTALAGRVYC